VQTLKHRQVLVYSAKSVNLLRKENDQIEEAVDPK
jgi:hypothetical protein